MSDRISQAVADRLAAIIESSDDAIISKDLNGIVVTWNRGAERMIGYSAAEIVGRPVTTIIPGDRVDEENDVLTRMRRGEPVEHYETLRRRKDGTLVPVSLSVSPIRDASGEIIGASSIARDITERRRAEAALAAAEARQTDLQQRLVALVAASGTLFGSPKLSDIMPAVITIGRTLVPADGYAVWRLDAAANTWHVGASHGISEAFSHSVVGTPGEAPGGALPFTDPLVAESVETVPLLAQRLDAFRAEGIVSMLAVPLTISGQSKGTLSIYFRAPHRFSEVEIHTARALGTLAAAALATAELYEQQRRSREAAERANQQAAFLAEASTALASSLDYEATLRTVAALAVPHIADWCAVDVTDEHGVIRRLAVAHVDPAKVELARTFQERFPDTVESPGPITTVIRSGTPVLVEAVTDDLLVRGARSPEHLAAVRALGITSFISVPLAVHGRIHGALTFVTADSGRHYTAADLRFAEDVAYRSALAIENALAYREANAANRAKDEFLATLSHELRTPLNAVLGWIRMLRSGSVTPAKMTRAFEVIERNAVAQLDLVEDLLDLSRIITGKFRLDVAPVRVAAAIDAAVEAVQPAATAKGIMLDVQHDEAAGLVLGDVARLQQVVWNLLSNAIKFTPSGGRVIVRVARRGPDIEVLVTDTGEGIDPAVLPYVFDRFRQGDSGTTRTHMGLGLGLAIVRHIVELHGGRVAVGSGGKGKGATFTIVLPAAPATRAPAASSGRAATASADSVLDGLHVLVVEDDEDARELIGEILRARGARVTATASGEECLDVVDRDKPDVIVSDIAMPGQDGCAMMGVLRKRPADRGGRVPAIALSALARTEDAERALAAGFQAHLAKPVDVERLLATIAGLTGRLERST